MEAKYIVTADHPYYPEIEYCNTLGEARKARDEFKKELFDEEGHNDCKITIAQVLQTTTGNSHY
jgi:bacterioferritin (cytochrome b1)